MEEENRPSGQDRRWVIGGFTESASAIVYNILTGSRL